MKRERQRTSGFQLLWFFLFHLISFFFFFTERFNQKKKTSVRHTYQFVSSNDFPFFFRYSIVREKKRETYTTNERSVIDHVCIVVRLPTRDQIHDNSHTHNSSSSFSYLFHTKEMRLCVCVCLLFHFDETKYDIYEIVKSIVSVKLGVHIVSLMHTQQSSEEVELKKKTKRFFCFSELRKGIPKQHFVYEMYAANHKSSHIYLSQSSMV